MDSLLPRKISLAVSTCVLALVMLVPAGAVGQSRPLRAAGEAFVGSEMEEYLRFLQTSGDVPLYPWSVRGHSPAALGHLLPSDSAHPWGERRAYQADTGNGPWLDLIRPEVRFSYNSEFPYGANDGPVWAGRGLTSSLQAGLAARYGPVSLVVAPTIFRAENLSFPLAPNGETGKLVYADKWLPRNIDRPQRFGDAPYVGFDPGQSTLRLDVLGFSLGASTANQYWGPATEHPIILGNNAAGFFHGFVGTSTPVDLRLGKLHGQVVWGRLDQSEYTRAAPDSSRRFMAGAVGVFVPRGVPGLEVGGARFFHTFWPSDGLDSSYFLKPFESILKSGLPDTGGADPKGAPDNQLASVFFRWVLPRSGFEFYGEYGREDHNWDMRDLLLQPDQQAAYMLGFRKIWRSTPHRFFALRGELINSQISHLRHVRPQGPFYQAKVHGHTHRGQILGSAAGYGGAGSILAADYYSERGRWTLAWRRTWNDPVVDVPDVTQSVGVESLIFKGRFDVTAGVTGVYNLNRNAESDRFNLNTTVGVRADL